MSLMPQSLAEWAALIDGQATLASHLLITSAGVLLSVRTVHNQWLRHPEVLQSALLVGTGSFLVTADLHQLEVVPCEEQSVRLLPV